ncbi:TadE/TadG family type IV pilus assembly protein [Profundibacterium mesophilum]|uniref:TadE-like protein domain containing protein n=1 Tax=Profundibacterium mesophilum KAUST100406-0324 TaxID=1037889 RepID=A0A921P0N5_9RHOB|nr:TadE/TadG family type IV pilus assembly protein [Profundibacterium mesophilum]KAF0677033.1 TadE-like protein domain containing protein [Profundibacterium mesophilum KAUST100406-0324]
MRIPARFLRREDGTATIEFVLLFMPLFMMMMSGMEAGLLNLRHVMLERGLDIAMRGVRIGSDIAPTHAGLKTAICENAILLPECEETLTIEMRRVSKLDWVMPDAAPTCSDRSEPIKPLAQFRPGLPSELMVVRACLKAEPIFPTSALGGMLVKDLSGDYALIASSAFVNEPK